MIKVAQKSNVKFCEQATRLYDAVRDGVVEHEGGAVAGGELALGALRGELVGQLLPEVVEEVAEDAVLQQLVLPLEVLGAELAVVLPVHLLVDNTGPALHGDGETEIVREGGIKITYILR